MNLKTTVLGLTTLISACGALGITIFYDNTALITSVWGLTGALACAWLLFNHQAVKRFFLRRSTRYGANLALVIFLVLGILVFLNILAKEHNWRKDFTRTGTNTLSPQTQKILSGLPGEVKAYYFNALPEKDKGEDLFKRYAYLSSKFKFEFVDIARRPTMVEAFGVRRTGAVVLTLAGTEKRMLVDAPTEEQVTNGLMKLLRSAQVTVYFTTGHDEHALGGEDPLSYGLLKAELDRQGYSVKELNLLSTGKVPDDAAVLIVGGPKKAFFPKELEIISNFVKGGGHALFSVNLDLRESGLSVGSRQLAEITKPFGVQIMSKMLVDPSARMAKVEPQILLGFSGSKEHPVTRDFAHAPGVVNFLFPLSTYLTVDPKSVYRITALATSSPTSWAVDNWASVKAGSVSKGEGDVSGPMDLAYAVETKAEEGAASPPEHGVKLLVFANSLFATNNAYDKVGNRDFILNSIAWLADDVRFISIRAKEDPDALRQTSGMMLALVLLVPVLIFPLFVLGLGGRLWWRRRKL